MKSKILSLSKVLTPSLTGRVRGGAALLFLLLFLVSCSSSDSEYDPHYNWPERNVAWYHQIADSARTAINEARKAYGDEWENHCDWRMYKSLLKSSGSQSGLLEDSICVHILSKGSGTTSPLYTDSVRVSFRGWLMPTTDANGKPLDTIFSQTYYGTYDTITAAPQLAGVSSFKPGIATAIQYMHEGDEWMIYVPQELFYGTTVTGSVPAYSTIRMRLHLRAIYPLGTTVPTWK